MGGKRKSISNLVRIPSEGYGPVWLDKAGNQYEEVRDKFMELLRLLYPVIAHYEQQLPPAQRHTIFDAIPDIRQFYPVGSLAAYVQMSPEQQQAFNELYLVIGKSIREAYNRGVDDGKDLLLGLAKGTISLTDFDAALPIAKNNDGT